MAVGRVVDDSIVVLENIYRHRGLGDSVRDSVLTGTKEVSKAITSSTVTTVAVFLPIGFVGGIVSQFFLPFGLAVTFALLASLIVALTVIPVLAWFMVDRIPMKVDEHGEPPETIWQRIYTPILALALRRRLTKWSTLAIALVLFVFAMSLAPLLPHLVRRRGRRELPPGHGLAPAGCLHRRRARPHRARPRRSSSTRPPSPRSSSSSRRSRARRTPAPRRSNPPSPVAPPTAR